MANYGFSFSPTPGMDGAAGQSQPSGPTGGVQRPVEVRSYKLPATTTAGARSIAPAALLAGQGGSGIPSAQLLQMLVKAFAQPGTQPLAAPVVPPTMTPTTSVPQAAAVMRSVEPQRQSDEFATRVSFQSLPTGKATPVTQYFPPSVPSTPSAAAPEPPPQRIDLSPRGDIWGPWDGVRGGQMNTTPPEPSMPGDGGAPSPGPRIDYGDGGTPVADVPAVQPFTFDPELFRRNWLFGGIGG